ncbi:MAG: hypothetical protein ACREGI_01250 [Candidatus Levyibacteriota bacterium]
MSQTPDMDAVSSAQRDSEVQATVENFNFKDKPSQATKRWLGRRRGRWMRRIGTFLGGVAAGVGGAIIATHLPIVLPMTFFGGLGDKLLSIFTVSNKGPFGLSGLPKNIIPGIK